VQEAPLDLIRPSYTVAENRNGLPVVEIIARQAEADAQSALDRAFYRHMARIAKEFHGYLYGADKPEEVPLPPPLDHEPENLHADINNALLKLTTTGHPLADAMRLVIAATCGKLSLVGVGFSEYPDGKDKVRTVRKLTGVVRTDLPPGCWINDATADPEEIAAALGHPVKDITPKGRLLLQRPVLQIIPDRDVTRGRKPEAVLPILRGLLYDLPQERIGLLTHSTLAKRLPKLLPEADRERLVKVHYFGGGESRGSNDWFRECDALIVLGTPRVGPEAIRERLIRLGKVKAAMMSKEEAGWGWDYWSGVTESGKRRTVKCLHYTDHDWHAAYCNIVRSELVQAIGRGRGILEDGIPVYVVSNENLAPTSHLDGRFGFPLADKGRHDSLADPEADVLRVMREQRRPIITTKEIATALELTTQWVLKSLSELQKAGRVIRIGQRGGWSLPG
jgi:hypothetical protein